MSIDCRYGASLRSIVRADAALHTGAAILRRFDVQDCGFATYLLGEHYAALFGRRQARLFVAPLILRILNRTRCIDRVLIEVATVGVRPAAILPVQVTLRIKTLHRRLGQTVHSCESTGFLARTPRARQGPIVCAQGMTNALEARLHKVSWLTRVGCLLSSQLHGTLPQE